MPRALRVRCLPAVFSSLRFLVLIGLSCAAIATSSSAQTLTTLVNFAGANGNAPIGSMVQGADGNFYGTTNDGGQVGSVECYGNGCGTVFKMTPAGTLTTLYFFCSQVGCPDGEYPQASLVIGSDGNLYGTTVGGGIIGGACGQPGCGTVFRITPAGTLTTLHKFCSEPNCADGYSPSGGLLLASDGNLYGATLSGGVDAFGVLYKIAPDGTFTTFYNFCSLQHCADGESSMGNLIQAADGNLYGTTEQGGAANEGTVFKITLGGTLATLHSFISNEGSFPQSGLTQGNDGNFYGAAQAGGITNDVCSPAGCGTIYKITPGGALTVLHEFTGADGSIPISGLVQATNGKLYGGTWWQGPNNCGTLYEVTTSGAFSTVYNFNCYDGQSPMGAPMQSVDGSVYGTAAGGGSSGLGTVFRLNLGLAPFVQARPSSGAAGTPVTIYGSYLTGATSVSFNGTPATFNVVSPTEITTTVPSGATTGTIQVSVPGNTLLSNTNFQVAGPLQFVPWSPCRVVDTRGQYGQPIQGGTTQDFNIADPYTCGIPTSAAAYSLNVTAVPHGPLGYLTIWPQGNMQPFASTLNSRDGRVKANAAIVPAGNHAVSVYVTDTTDLVLDINGYFVPPAEGTWKFYPLTPCRVADTRSSQYPQGLGTPHLSGGVARDFPVLSSPCVPAGGIAFAYSLNITAVPYPGPGSPMSYLEVLPTGSQPFTTVSTLNNPTGTIVANAAIVQAGVNDSITAVASDDTDLVIDINGYFGTIADNGLSLYPTLPCRVIDTRNVGTGQPFSGTLAPPVDVANSNCGVPGSAQAYIFNGTVIPSPTLSYLTLWPDDEGQPVVSTLNAVDGFVTSNMAIVPNQNGKIDAYAQGTTQLILDISSYFAP